MRPTKPPQVERPLRREIELDFLRGIAILMVLDFHQAHSFLFSPFKLLGFRHFGWAGVDVFFVLSGFLVGGLLMKEWKLRSRIDARRFLIRRGFKIWPQYYVYLLLMLLSRHRTLHELRWNLLNVQNYLGGVAHTWSLAVEEHAYLFLVGCLALAASLRLRMRTLAIALSVIIVAVVILRQVLAAHGLPIFAPTHTRIDGILEGVLLAMLYHFRPAIFQQVQQLTWLWLLLLAASLVDFRLQTGSPATEAMSYNAANLLGIALLMLLYRHRADRRRSWLYRCIAWIGLYSYGIYLWHVSVIDTMTHLGQRLPLSMQPAWDSVLPMAAGVALGWLTTRLIEAPALHLRDRLFPRRVDSAVGRPAELEAEDTAAKA